MKCGDLDQEICQELSFAQSEAVIGRCGRGDPAWQKVLCSLHMLSFIFCLTSVRCELVTGPPSPRYQFSFCNARVRHVCTSSPMTKSPSLRRAPRPTRSEALTTDISFSMSSRTLQLMLLSHSLFLILLTLHPSVLPNCLPYIYIFLYCSSQHAIREAE